MWHMFLILRRKKENIWAISSTVRGVLYTVGFGSDQGVHIKTHMWSLKVWYNFNWSEFIKVVFILSDFDLEGESSSLI